MEMAMNRTSRMGARGMSMIEVLIALSILALALLGLMPLFIGAVKTSAAANQITSANTLVREKLEELVGYPRNDPRIAVPAGQNSASFPNDLPSWYNPSTGATSFAATSPGPGWYVYPYTRTYTVQEFAADLTTPVTESAVPPTPTPPPPPAYFVKLVTVTVRPTEGPFPGLRQTTQSLYLRFPNG
jgi:prepilin-type N-terminal cleavage/methylation domain-containing protein